MENRVKTYWLFVSILTLVSMGIGFILGEWAEFLYVGEQHEGIGWLSGIIFSFLAGIIYSFLLKHFHEKKQSGITVLKHGLLMGIATGVICSTCLHIVLMIYFNELAIEEMLFGDIFGIAAGAILGLISTAIFKGCYKKQIVQA